MERAIKLNSDYVKLKVAEKGWSIADFAAQLGVVYNTCVKYLESDEVRISVVNKMARVLNVDVEQLIYVKVQKEM